MRLSRATRPFPPFLASGAMREPAERAHRPSGARAAVQIESAQIRRGKRPVAAAFQAYARGSASVPQRTLRLQLRGSLSRVRCGAVRFRFDAACNHRDSEQRPPFGSNHQTDSLVRVFLSRSVTRRARSACALHASFQYAVRARSGGRLGAHYASRSQVVCS